MKTKLLKKLRRESKDQVILYTVTKTNGEHSGLKYGYDNNAYAGLSDSNSVEEFYQKVFQIYMEVNNNKLKRKYKK